MTGEESEILRFELDTALEDDIASCAKDGSFMEGLEKISEALKALTASIDNATIKARQRNGNA